MDVYIHSTRCKSRAGIQAMREWLYTYADGIWYPAPGFVGLEEVKYTYEKVPALIYIDDRAWRFEGVFPTLQQIHQAKPWNKR